MLHLVRRTIDFCMCRIYCLLTPFTELCCISLPQFDGLPSECGSLLLPSPPAAAESCKNHHYKQIPHEQANYGCSQCMSMIIVADFATSEL